MDGIKKLDTRIQHLNTDKGVIASDNRKQELFLLCEFLVIAIDLNVLRSQYIAVHDSTTMSTFFVMFVYIAMICMFGADSIKRICNIKENRKKQKHINKELRELNARKQELQSLLNRVSKQH